MIWRFASPRWQFADAPTITLEDGANGALRPERAVYAKKFSDKYSQRTLHGVIGHNLPQEASKAFADAVIEVDRY